MSADTTPCADCGMPCTPREYHPYAACLMFKACHNSDTVRANLATARAPARASAPAPQGPTDAELIAFQEEEQYGLYCDPDDFVDIARAVLARWGAPAASGEPVARKPLTDEQINELADQCRAPGHGSVWPHAFAKSLEAAHGIKP